MRWLQWGPLDFENGQGGVEVHARNLRRELTKLGWICEFSSETAAFNSNWDVIHTHGSSVPLGGIPLRSQGKRVLWIHTLHGTTLGRMKACREWLWIGGHTASARETAAVVSSDLTFGVHSNLYLMDLAKKLGKGALDCSNGWDNEGDALDEVKLELQKFLENRPWIFIGRGGDRVKGTKYLIQAWSQTKEYLLAVPGDGFESVNSSENTNFLASGRLSGSQVRFALKESKGLVLPSLYEGLPLVVLEALAQGVPVIASRVGGLKTLSEELQGIHYVKPRDLLSLKSELEKDVQNMGLVNRPYLKTWREVAEVYVKGVEARI